MLLDTTLATIARWKGLDNGPKKEMKKRKFGVLSSSANPEKMSMTVTSIVALIVTGLTLYFSMRGIEPPADLNMQVENIVRMSTSAVAGVGIVISAVTGVVGLVRKLAAQLGK